MSRIKKQKEFLVFNTACFGDVLLCNTLCQNIKLLYPESKVIMIVDKPFKDAAKYQKDVDDVVIYDKKGIHKGIKGLIKFIFEFPYKKPYCSFITYTNIRNSMISRFIGAQKVISLPKSSPVEAVQKRTLGLLAKITDKKLYNLPIRYKVSDNPPENLEIDLNKKYIGLCTLSKRKEKDMPLETAVELIKELNNTDYEVIYFGAGSSAVDYAKSLEEAGCKFVNLVNKTTIYEMACTLKVCKALISIDTGTMHLGCALDIPLAAVFYENNMTSYWAPDNSIYNVCVIKENQTAKTIIKELNKLIQKGI